MLMLLLLQGAEYLVGRQRKAIVWLQANHLGATAEHRPKELDIEPVDGSLPSVQEPTVGIRSTFPQVDERKLGLGAVFGTIDIFEGDLRGVANKQLPERATGFLSSSRTGSRSHPENGEGGIWIGGDLFKFIARGSDGRSNRRKILPFSQPKTPLQR